MNIKLAVAKILTMPYSKLACRLLLWLFVLPISLVWAQNETEPNNSFTDANLFASSSSISGSLSSVDQNDYFVSIPADDGTIEVVLDFNNNSGSTGADLYLYAYNKNGSQIGNIALPNQALGAGTDTVRLYCREADSIFFRVNSVFNFSYTLHFNTYPSGTSDAEPNNDLASATYFAPADTVKGRVGYVSVAADANDYFYSDLPDDGTLKVYLKYNNTSNSNGADLYEYVYNKNGSLIGSSSLTNRNPGVGFDTLTIYCKKQDTIYFRLNASGCFSYELHYEIIPSGQVDTEPNDLFSQSLLATANDTTRGRIGYSSISSDANDYFLGVLPSFGTLKLYFWYTNTSGGNSADLYAYIYNKSFSLIGSKSMTNQVPGTPLLDSITVYCRELDTVYIRFSASGCFSYKFYYEVKAPTTNDAEPNNAFAQAGSFNFQDTVEGRIGYQSVGTDGDDYFLSVLPDDGTLEYYLEYYNTSNSTGSDLYAYIYNKNGSLIGSSSLTNRPLGIGHDTIRVYCRLQDSVYFRISSSGCFSYRFFNQLVPSGAKDTEPNNGFSQATLFGSADTVRGRIGYTSVSPDNNDYFLSVLPDDGTLIYYLEYNNTSNSNGADLYSYIYNKNGSLIGSSSLTNQNPGIGYDTIRIPCRLEDSIYFRLSSSGCFSYNFRYEVQSSGSRDAEPNGSFGQAVFFNSSDTVNGRVGYVSTAADADDYFVSVLPDDGTLMFYLNYNNTSNSSGADLYAYIYNRSGSLIGNKSLTNQLPGPGSDSIIVHCRLSDSVYFRINGNGCFSYNLHYQVKSYGQADPEPNETALQAVAINLADTLSGRIGYAGVSADNNDYFEFYNAGYSTITAVLSARNTANTNSPDFYTYLYNSNGGLVTSRSYTNQNPGPFWDTIVLSCLPRDTFRIRVTSNGCFSYQFTFDVADQQPVASIEEARFGNRVSYASRISNADSLYWNFDDGTGSDLSYPEKEFAIGVYDVTLTSFNRSCNITAIDTSRIIVTGIEDYQPRVTGTDTLLGYFSLRIFGGGLDSNMQVVLSNGSIMATPEMLKSQSLAEATALFRFDELDFGSFDVDITLSNGDKFSFPDGIEIVQEEPGIDIVTTITGPTRIRTNRWTNFTLNVSNNKKRLANGVVACIVVPDGVETNIHEVLRKKTGTFTVKDEVWDLLTIERQSFNDFYFQGSFDPALDTVFVNYDSLCADMEAVASFDIDSLFGQAFSGRVYPILLPLVPGESTFQLQFKVRSLSNQLLSLLSYSWVYTLRQNPVSGETLDYIHEGGMQAAALAEYAPNPALRAVGKSAGWIDIGSKVIFTEAFDWYYGVNNADASFYAEQGLAATVEYAAGKNPYGKNFEKAERKVVEAKNGLRRSTEYESILRNRFSNNRKVPEVYKQQLLDEHQRVTREVAKWGDRLTFSEKQARINAYKEYALKRGISLTTNQVNKLLFGEDPKTNVPDHINRNRITSVTSMDPNDISGTQGPGFLNYIERNTTLSYQVNFENVDTAKAPAQVVRVIMQFDTALYDLSSLEIGNIGFGGNTYFMEQDRNSYFREIDLRPDKDFVVRVLAGIDTLTGKFTCTFLSLDTATGELIDDVDDGFLPPNVNYPEGEGFITFNIKHRDGVTDQDSIALYADIFFDENEPIQTNIWYNQIDEGAPSSNLLSYTLENDTSIILQYTGSDDKSGVERFYLNINRNGEGWIGARGRALAGMSEVSVSGQIGDEYEFIILARDSVGNFEEKPLNPELKISLIPEQSNFASAFQLYPNPSTGVVNIRSNGNFLNTSLEVSDVSGRLVFKQDLNFYKVADQFITLSKLSGGTYFFNFRDANGHISTQKLILVHP